MRTARAYLSAGLLGVAISTTTLVVMLGGAEPRLPDREDPSNDRSLDGVWVHLGEPGNVNPPPRSGGRVKFRVGNRWTLTRANPSSRTVTDHFGGTYRVRGDDYAETIDYSLEADDPELGRTLTFKVTVEGARMIQTGVNNPYTEVWQRIH